jgi:SAM-dependent methyltransferase
MSPELYSRRLKDPRLERALSAGTRDHYVDAVLYDHEYKRRRDDIAHYRKLARDIGGPILDLGCGTGRILLPLLRDGHEVVGVDASATMLERLRQKNPKARVVEGDIREISLGRKFPLVLCTFNTLMHLYERTDVEHLLDVVRRHLRPGGVFAFDVMNPDLAWLSRDPTRRWARTRFKHPRTKEWMVYTTSLEWEGSLQIAFMQIYYAKERGSRREKVVRLAHRYFFPQELEEIFFYNGFVIERHEGDFRGAKLHGDSEEQVCIARLRGGRKSPSRK